MRMDDANYWRSFSVSLNFISTFLLKFPINFGFFFLKSCDRFDTIASVRIGHL